MDQMLGKAIFTFLIINFSYSGIIDFSVIKKSFKEIEKVLGREEVFEIKTLRERYRKRTNLKKKKKRKVSSRVRNSISKNLRKMGLVKNGLDIVDLMTPFSPQAIEKKESISANYRIITLVDPLEEGPNLTTPVNEVRLDNMFNEQAYLESSKLNLTGFDKNSSIYSKIFKTDFLETHAYFRNLEFDLNIPFISINNYENFLRKNEISDEGNVLILALSENVDDVELDCGYSYKSKIEIGTSENPTTAVMFLGLPSGNCLISSSLLQSGIEEKVFYIHKNALTFIELENVFLEFNVAKFYRFNRLNGKKKYLKFDAEDMELFYSNANPYEVDSYQYAFGLTARTDSQLPIIKFNRAPHKTLMRSRREDQSFFIPDLYWYDTVFDSFGIDDLDGGCFTELKLPLPIISIDGLGSYPGDTEEVSFMYLDSDGSIYGSPSEETVSIFASGHHSESLNFEVLFATGKKRSLQTPCFENSFFIEYL